MNPSCFWQLFLVQMEQTCEIKQDLWSCVVMLALTESSVVTLKSNSLKVCCFHFEDKYYIYYIIWLWVKKGCKKKTKNFKC